MDTMEHTKRKKVQQHPPELRRQVLDACVQPGASVAKVALAHGLNANMVHAWRKQERDKQVHQSDGVAAAGKGVEFIALPMTAPTTSALPDIRIELRRGATTVSITWPVQAARECAVWLQEWLR